MIILGVRRGEGKAVGSEGINYRFYLFAVCGRAHKAKCGSGIGSFDRYVSLTLVFPCVVCRHGKRGFQNTRNEREKRVAPNPTAGRFPTSLLAHLFLTFLYVSTLDNI